MRTGNTDRFFSSSRLLFLSLSRKLLLSHCCSGVFLLLPSRKQVVSQPVSEPVVLCGARCCALSRGCSWEGSCLCISCNQTSRMGSSDGLFSPILLPAKNTTLHTHSVVGPRSVMVHRLASRVQAKYSMGLALSALFL